MNEVLTGVTFRRLEPSMADVCTSMTFPAYRHLLPLRPVARHPEQGDQKLVQPVGVVALAGTGILGLALAEVPLATDGVPELLSLFVDEGLRGRGVATTLVLQLEEELAAKGCAELRAVYMTGKPSIPAVERVFAKRGFSAPEARTVTLRFTPTEALQTPWFRRIKLSSEYEVVPWAEITPAERERIQSSNAEKPWIAGGLEPWKHDRNFHPVSSLGLRYKGEVVGWVINHQVTADTVRFTCSFMRKDLGRRGRIMPLYTISLERLREAGCQQCTFVTPVSYKTMVEFARKRCAPWASFLGETRGVSKKLGHLP
jgi:GNAT superfamily N-acetyltransferase